MVVIASDLQHDFLPHVAGLMVIMQEPLRSDVFQFPKQILRATSMHIRDCSNDPRVVIQNLELNVMANTYCKYSTIPTANAEPSTYSIKW